MKHCPNASRATLLELQSLALREEALEGQYALQLWPSRLYALPVGLFTFMWLRFLWRWYALIALASSDDSRGFLVLFGLPFLLAGISLIATSLRLAFGRSLVVIDGTRLVVAEQTLFDVLTPSLVTPTVHLIGFVAFGPHERDPDASMEHEVGLDAWQVHARLDSGESIVLPLPVRSEAEAELIARRLERGLAALRAPRSYRDSPSAMPLR